MRKDILNIEVERSADEIAGEFLRVQEVRRPNTIEELQQATTSANDEIERVLFHRDRWRAMKTEDQEESTEQEGLYDEWVDVTLDLEEAFIDENAGALGKRVVELLALDAGAFAECAEEARFILQQTTPMALRVYPFMHRLVDLGIASDRAAVVERLSSGDLVKQEKIHNVSVTPRRRTIIGLLRDLDARLPLAEQTDIWSLEVAPELPAVAVISDPFQSGNEDLATYWGQRISGAHETYGRTAAILSLSGDKTASVTYELENIAEQVGDEVLKHAAKSIATWLEGKQIYYTDPDPRDFELYHLGMEDPQQLMEIMRSLDVIKHLDPELFFELIGIDPSQGGRSLYFGSFLHKALFNTQRTLDHASPELGQMALQTMMRQLLTLDERVQTYSAVVSQESLRSMAGEMKKSVDAANTKESKAQTLMMMAVPFSRMAIDAEVRRQLDALRESSSENVVEELRRRIDDIEHPLKLADYLVGLPKRAVDDVRVRRELRKILPEEQIESGSFRNMTACSYKGYTNGSFRCDFPGVLRELYQHIPLIDEGRDDLGFALRIKIALRDALTFAHRTEEMVMPDTSEGTRARQFLKVAMPNKLYREDFEVIQDQMGLWERPIAERFSYATRSEKTDDPMWPTFFEGLVRSSGEDGNYFIGCEIVASELKAKRDRASESGLFRLFLFAKEARPDLVFLTILAHPKGKEVAFKYFDKFCDMIPTERMCELLKGESKPCEDFRKMFLRTGPESARTYLNYLRGKVRGVSPWREEFALVEFVQPEGLGNLSKINKVLLEAKTPWTKAVTIEAWNSHGNMGSVGCVIDAWEIWDVLGRPSGFNPEDKDSQSPNGWDRIDTSQRYSIKTLGQIIFGYFVTGKGMAADNLPLIIRYLEHKRDEKNKQSYR